MPKADSRVLEGSTILLYADDTEAGGGTGPGEDGTVVMPDVTGLSLKECLERFTQLGLVLEAQGSGIAVEQEVPEGTSLEAGASVAVLFEIP